MHHTSEDRTAFLKGLGYMVITILIWAGWAISNRMGFQGHLNTYDMVAARMVVAGVLSLPLLMRYGLRVGPLGVWGALILMVTAGAPYCMLSSGGFAFAPASHVSIINATIIVLTVTVGILVLKERNSWVRWAGLAVVLAGVSCVMLSKSPSDVAGNAWMGHVLFLMAGISWGIFTLLAKAWKVEPLQGIAVVSVLSLITYLPVYLLWLPKGMAQASWQEVAWQGVYQGLITSMLALLTYTRAIALLGASSAGAFVPTVPVVVALLGMAILGEMPSALEWIGILTVVAGVFAASGTLEQLRWRNTLA